MDLYEAFMIDFISDDIYLKTNAHVSAMLWVYCPMVHRNIWRA